MKKIYLVRHAQSNSNVDMYVLHKTPNPNISLSQTGIEQAKETGKFLSSLKLNGSVVWNSPYHRTRQTSFHIKDEMKAKGNVFTEKENIYISERQFGLVDDVPNYQQSYKDAVNHYKMHSDNNTNFFVRPPLGESPFDMAIRLDTFMKLYIEMSKEDNHIIVSHGAALRGILMMCLGWTFEQYTEEPNFHNAAVRLITFDNGLWTDEGYVFEPKILSS